MVLLPGIFYILASFNAFYLLGAGIFSSTWLMERIATVIDESFQKWVRIIGSANILIGITGFIFLIPSTAIIIVDGSNPSLDWSVVTTLAIVVVILSIRAVNYLPTRSLISLGISISMFAVIIFLSTQNIFIPGISLLMFSASFLIGRMIQDILEITTGILSNPIVTLLVAGIAIGQASFLIFFHKSILAFLGIVI